MVMSPDDYRKAAGYRRSSAVRRVPIGGSDRPVIKAFTAMDWDSPLLADFLGNGRLSSAGVSVNEKLALRNSAFFRSVNLIASAMGMLPTFLMRRKADGTTEKAKDHPLYRVLHKRPNDFQTAFEFKAHMQAAALFDGNAYALIIRGALGGIKQMVPLKRGSVEPLLSDDWVLTFRYNRPNGGQVILPARDVFHFRHPVSRCGLKGISLLDVAVEAIGLAAVADKALGRLLSGGVMAGGSLESDKELGEEAIARLKESLAEDHSGADNAGEWLILEEGLKAKPFAIPKDSQTEETRKRQAEEVSRFTGVPRPLLMFDETSWGSGIEQLGQFFVTYCLMPWFGAWEQAIERSCLTTAEQDADELYVKFNEGALLRGSLKDQAEFFSKALGNNSAWMKQNEVRANFDLNPEEGGETLPPPRAVGPASSPKKDPTDD